MIKNLFINGCSFSEGNGICEELGLEIDSEKEKNEWSYGAHLSKLLNLNHINYAEGGSSNRRICRTTMEWCHKNKDMMKETFFIIQWSYAGRIEEWSSFPKKYRMKEYWHQTHFSNNKLIPALKDQISHTQLYILCLVNFFRYNKLSFLFFQGDTTEVDKDISRGYFIDWIKDIDFFTPSFVEFSQGDLTPNRHPSKKKNEEWANLLHQHLKPII